MGVESSLVPRGIDPSGPRLEGAAVQPFAPELGAALRSVCADFRLDPFIVLSAAAGYALSRFCGKERFAAGFAARAGAAGELSPAGSVEFAPGPDDTLRSLAAALAASAPRGGVASGESPTILFRDERAASGDPSDDMPFDEASGAVLPELVIGLSPERAVLRSPRRSADAFVADALCRAVAGFVVLAVSEPERALDALPLVPSAGAGDRAASAAVGEARGFSDGDLYEALSRNSGPENRKTALICEGRRMSYAELGAAVESAAAALAAAGIPRGGLVGVCLKRSLEMVVAVLAVIRNGCAYVPLDPAYPRSRLDWIIENSALAGAVASESTRGLLNASPALPVVDLSGEGAGAAGTIPPPARVPGSAPAYVIYTSGSTGNPKGVAVPRSAAANLLLSMLERPGIGETDTLCAVTTLSFDISVLELFAPLCAGATVVVATESDARDPRSLAALLSEYGVTVLQATPVTWRLLCDSGWSGDPCLTALCGGEALPSSLARVLFPKVRALWNMYGPTETTVWSTCRRIEDPAAPVSVGAPIADTSVYVLDGGGRLLPYGAEGRLFIGGAGVAIGYLHAEELTRKRFFPDPFAPGGRMYDTGDLARFGPDGGLYLSGRSDLQVKLNGFRIELEEIEARICQLKAVAQAAVVLLEEDADRPELAAFYIAAAGGDAVSPDELRRWCAASLPHYMVPARFVALGELPRMPNGKIDRAALREGRRDMSRTGDGDPLGVSAIQKQFLVNASLFADSSAYNIACLFEPAEEVDEARLADAWRRVLLGVPILRSAVAARNGEDAFVEYDASPDAFKIVDCPGNDLAAFAEAEASAPISPRRPPLARLIVIRASGRPAALLLVLHHIVSDLFSTGLVADYLSAAYDDPRFVPEVLPYERYRDAEASFLAGEAGSRAAAYWTEKTARFPEALRLPHATCRPEPFRGLGRSLPWRLPDDLAGALAAAEPAGKIPFLQLLCAYAALLYRLSGQERFLIGVPLTNRNLIGDGPVLGPCVNILPVAVELDPSRSFDELYAALRKELLLNHRNQSVPFMRIASSFQGERDPLRPRLLQAGFTNEPLIGLRLGGAECRSSHVRRAGAQMDLFFTWWQRGGSWEGHWEFNAGSYAETDAELWQKAFSRLLAAALRSPALPVSGVALSDGDEAAVLAGNGREVSYPLETSLARHLRASFAAHGDRTALVYEGGAVSYDEMGGKAAAVASYLLRAAGGGGRVAVMLPRSPEMLYALHGIVQSGNAYVPLGIDWPEDRTRDVVRDVRPALLIGAEADRDRASAFGVPFATIAGILAAEPSRKQFPETEIGGDDPMYIMYTSGTTGKPKGAVLPHRGIVNRLLWMQDEYRLTSDDRVLLKTPYTFDVSVWELFWPFLAGASLVIASEGLHKDPRSLLELIEKEAVTVMHFVPSMLSHFLSQPGLERAKSLRDVVCSGEALPPALVGRFFDSLPGTRLHNLYGPTEASIDVTYWPCSREDSERGVVPIGYPIANTRIYVLDSRGNPCPPYVKGEIHIGGVGLAKGYWEREELTREKFIPDPFGDGRLYRTGDWGRYRPDGAVEYLERLDNQVKIHGIRVELDEIELRLRMLPGVRDAAVKKGAEESGEECLIAYYVADAELDLEAAKRGLRRYLPEATIPGAFVRLGSMPLNENGKANRKALPGTVVRPKAAAVIAGSFSPTERRVADAWKAVLDAPQDSADRNFFDVGGNSLSLLSLRGLLEREFGVTLGVLDLFQNPTIAKMASLVGAPAEGSASGESVSSSVDERARQRRAAFKRPGGPHGR